MSLKLQVDRLTRGGSVRVELRLQLGCGSNILEGWLNTDSTPSIDSDYLDFTGRMPFPDNVVTAVFCEHTIEHITKQDALRMVGEVFRILRPGGLFRVVTPSLEKFCRMVLEPGSPRAQQYLTFVKRFMNNTNATMTDAMNLCFYGHGHRYVYSRDQLDAVLLGAGFIGLQFMDAGEYGHPIFNGVDGHGKVVGHDINAIEAMAIEAVKPV